MEEKIWKIIEELQGLSKVAVIQYTSVVDDILNEISDSRLGKIKRIALVNF